MVFARLTPADKDAFFALLDELSGLLAGVGGDDALPHHGAYFESRPELFKNGSGSGANATNGIAAGRAAVASAFSAAASATTSASPPPPVNGWKRPDAAATADIGSSVGRVAAAAAALKQNGGDQIPGFPRPPPRRNPSQSSEEPAPEHTKLVQTRKFGGDVDVSSAKNMFSSIRGSTAAKHATPAQVAPPTPPAFSRRNDFAPPPRRVPSTSGSSNASPAANTPPPPVPRRAQQEPEVEGEWAEALYDYHSEDPGDLDLQEGVRVLITEKTSDDWWTGEIDAPNALRADMDYLLAAASLRMLFKWDLVFRTVLHMIYLELYRPASPARLSRQEIAETNASSNPRKAVKTMAKAKAAAPTSSSGGKAAKKKKWSKGKVKDKAQHAVVLDKATYDRILKEVPTFRFISQSILIERLKINGSLARVAIRHLEKEGQIKRIVHHSGQLIYTRSTGGGSD
ncbi:hypothetical protein ONZ51_g215 [Trametes cubensis]|uniref:SH3 domain-containing protein n=1 Tax=Trametes cubensis TaxID=1111947 RepID=A0AAD7XIV2_9APHY|nr:hypothetical protein ONZ51_g215 [Trametes cubensis]